MSRKPLGIALLVGGVVALGVMSCEKQTAREGAACPLPNLQGEVVSGQSATNGAAEEVRAVALERGKRIVAEAMKTLSGRLAAALAAGGVTNALSACSIEALPLTRAVALSNEVVLRRVTHRPRNPADRADATELKIIEAFRRQLEVDPTSVLPVVVSGAGGAATFYAPIILNNPLCLNCHGQPGTDIQPASLASIAGLYPQDEATGFRLGDLRGMWRIDFPAGAAAGRTGEGAPAKER